jgi:hypothetical protein
MTTWYPIASRAFFCIARWFATSAGSIRDGFVSAIWIAYFTTSVRVKNTFVR